MNITVREELRSLADPLTSIEYAALERSLLAEGCRDALVLWGEVLVDGHNRYDICRKHGIEFRTVQNNGFTSIDEVMLWVIDNHLARRSVSDYQRGVLALRKKDLVAVRQPAVAESAPQAKQDESAPRPAAPKRAELAREARVSANTISQIEQIQKSAAPQLVEAVRAGTISINAAANVASLPPQEQIAAVAGGRKELQQAARQVREQKAAGRVPREPKESDAESGAEEGEGHQVASLIAQVAALKKRIVLLTAENAALKEQLATSGRMESNA